MDCQWSKPSSYWGTPILSDSKLGAPPWFIPWYFPIEINLSIAIFFRMGENFMKNWVALKTSMSHTKNRQVDWLSQWFIPQMLHGAGIFTNICPNKITQFCIYHTWSIWVLKNGALCLLFWHVSTRLVLAVAGDGQSDLLEAFAPWRVVYLDGITPIWLFNIAMENPL